MAGTVGKITGQMLANDLLRDGVDLAFDTDLIYLDVVNRRVGIKTDTPIRPLQINGTFSTSDLLVDTSLSIPNFTFSGHTISNNSSNIYLSSNQPGGSITTGSIELDGLKIDNNQIYSTRSNENIDFTPAGSGIVSFNSNVEVSASVHVTGNVTFDGSIIIGSDNTDSVIFDTEVISDIIPDVNATYYLGTATKKWQGLDTNFINGNTVVAINGATVFGIDMNLRQGNIWYVSTNGTYDNFGDHPNDAFDTIEKALTVATAGDTILIYPGTYYELLPLIVPAGVTIKGFGVRSVTIKPDTASLAENVFLLNGETTVEDLTIADYYYDSINDTGYAFSFAPNFTVTTRSPYIRNVTVITKGSVTSLSDPRGYDTGDAGRGAKIDGSLANSSSIEASMLFHSATFLTPGQRCLWLTNGVRVEWLNCFIYFASEGLYADVGATGFAGDGKTRLKVYGISAQTVNPGDTVSIENVSLSGTFTTGTIESISYDGAYSNVVIDGYVLGFEPSASPPDTSNQQQINFSGGQTASHLEWVDYSDFGAELRAIGSANVYGNVGAKADGNGTLMYLISHNFGYIGSGKLSTNDTSDVIDTNETIELNNGKIYYQSMDQEGNFRVGDIFKVESATGRITFQSNLFTGTNLTLSDGTNESYIDAFEVSTGNITISGNTIQSNTGGITLKAANNEITITDNFTTNNNLTANIIYLNKNTTIGDSNTDSINFVSEIATNFIPKTNFLNLGLDNKRWKTLYSTNLTFDDILIDSNVITTTLSNSNLQLDANGSVYFDQISFTNNSISSFTNTNININPNGTGTIQLQKDTYLTGSLDVTGNATVAGNVQIGDIYLDTINPVGKIGSDIIPFVTGLYDIGSDTNRWNNIYLDELVTDSININTNFINNTESNANLELRANGAGSVQVDLLNFKSNTITSNTTNTDIQINPNGTGIIQLLKDTFVATDLSVSGQSTFNSSTVLGNSSSDTVIFNSRITTDLIPSSTFLYNIGSTSLTWNNTYLDQFVIDNIVIDTNVISSIESNANLEFNANGTGRVIFENINISDNSITTDNNTNIIVNPNGTGSIQLLKNTIISGAVGSSPHGYIFNAGINTDFIPSASNVYALGSNSYRWRDLYTNNLWVDNINVDTNVIQITESNANLEFRANGTGSIQIDNLLFKSNIISSNTTNLDIIFNPDGAGSVQLLKDVDVTGNLDITGDVSVGGNVQIGDVILDQIDPIGRFSSNITPGSSGQYDIGSVDYTWRNLYFANTEINDIVINDNYISTINSNADLELRANGAGIVRSINNFTVDQNLTLLGSSNLQTTTIVSTTVNGNINVTNSFNAVEFFTGDILINDNYITTTLSNSNLELRGNASGGIILNETIKITDSTISNILLSGTESQRSVNFTPMPTKILKFGNTTALKLPAGSNTTRTLSTNGEMRFNNTSNTFEGRITGGTKSLYALYDVDGNTGITAELTPGLNDNTIRMYVNGNIESTITSSQTTFNRITVDELEFNNNRIATMFSNADLELERSGAGTVLIQNNISITNNLIFNITNNAATEIATTGTGYVDFYGNGGVVIPSGTTGQQLSIHPVGAIRWNTSISSGEVWTGSAWISMSGVGPFVFAADMEDISLFWALLVG